MQFPLIALHYAVDALLVLYKFVHVWQPTHSIENICVCVFYTAMSLLLWLLCLLDRSSAADVEYSGLLKGDDSVAQKSNIETIRRNFLHSFIERSLSHTHI